jgi:hypothetical protein
MVLMTRDLELLKQLRAAGNLGRNVRNLKHPSKSRSTGEGRLSGPTLAQQGINKNIARRARTNGHQLGHQLAATSRAGEGLAGTARSSSPIRSGRSGIEQDANGRPQENFKTGA